MPAIETAGTPRSFRLRSLTLVDPLLCCQRVLNQLFGTEEEINLKLSRFGVIGAMNDIVADLQSVIAADSAGNGLGGVCRAHRCAHDANGLWALDHPHHDWAGRDMLHQAIKERLAFVNAVMPLGQLWRNMHELEADQLQPALLKPCNHLSDQAALDPLGLDDNQCPFHEGICSPCL